MDIHSRCYQKTIKHMKYFFFLAISNLIFRFNKTACLSYLNFLVSKNVTEYDKVD